MSCSATLCSIALRIAEPVAVLLLLSWISVVCKAVTLPLQGKIHHVSPGIDLQRTIDATPEGDTIFFDAGTYNLKRSITLRSGILYHGSLGVVLKGAYPIFKTDPKDSHDIGIDGLTFEGGKRQLELDGANSSANKADRITIVNNTFRNMDLNKSPEKVDSTALEMNFVKNTFIDHNVFTNLNGGGAIMAYESDNTEVTFNIFNNLYEAVSMKFDGITGPGTILLSHITFALALIGCA